MCARVCVFMSLFVFSVRTNTSAYPTSHMSQSPVCCSQWTWFSTHTKTHTHTPKTQLLDGIIKVRLHRLPKTGMFFTHQKGNKLCLTGSNTLERLARGGRRKKKKKAAHLSFTLGYGSKICGNSNHGVCQSIGIHLFNITASTALGTLPAGYCDEISSSASVDLSNNKSYHQLVTEYGYLHPFSHSWSRCTGTHPLAFPLIHMHNCHHYLP